MATLQRIRNRAGLLIVVIGVAMLAFILGDFFSGNERIGRSSMMIAKIDGSNVYQKEYVGIEYEVTKFYELLYGLFYGQPSINEQVSQRARTQAWDDLLNKYILNEEYDKIGLAVSERELFNQFTGNNPHPLIRNLFSDPQTGMFNPEQIIQFLRSTEMDNIPDNITQQQMEQLEMYKNFRLLAEEQVEKDRLKTKFNTLFQKGMYITSLEAKNYFSANNSTTGFKYLVKNFASIPDSAIKMTESDLEKYYKENIKKYWNEDETRTVEYVTFEVIPTQADDEATKEEINKILPEFKEAEDTESFLRYIGSDAEYDAANYTKDKLPEIHKELFDQELGATYGPYFENDAYKIAKLAKINYMPDSVKARHILIGIQQIGFQAGKTIADSLTELIKNGADFGKLAEEHSEDQGSAMLGGDLGWFTEGKMVKPFNDTCFYGNKGDLKLAYSQYGIHIIQIQEQSRKVKKVQIGVAERKVEAGSETIDAAYRKAMLFAGEVKNYDAFKAVVEADPSIVTRQAVVRKEDMTMHGMPDSRKLIQWAYTHEEGDVSESAVDINGNYVVLGLKGINEKGPKPLETVRELVKLEVIKDKKAEVIKEQMEEAMASTSGLDQLAMKVGGNVVDAGEMAYGNPTPMLKNGSLEPKVLAVASVTKEGSSSQPIIGNSGVYIVETYIAPNAKEATPSDLYFSKMQMDRNQNGRFDVTQAIKDKSTIKDKRYNFF